MGTRIVLGAAALAALVYYAGSLTGAEAITVTCVALLALMAVIIPPLVTALRTSQLRAKSIFESNPTMYFMVDAHGTVVSVNTFGAQQLGYTVDELVGESVLKVFPDSEQAAASDHVASCLANLGESKNWELQKVRKDGTRLWVRETARAVRLGRGAPVVLIACEDITAAREAHVQLRTSEDRLRWQARLLDLTHDAIFVRGFDGVIIYWNRGAEALYGWTSAEVVGHTTLEQLKPQYPEPLQDMHAAVLRTGRWEGEVTHTKRDGSQVIVASRWSLHLDDHGTPIGVLQTHNDITARKQAEESLRKAQNELARASALTTMGQLAASIAHELRQPLAAIAMNGGAALRWLDRATPNLGEAREAATQIVQDAHRADGVIRGMWSLVGGSRMKREPINMNVAVQEVLELTRGELRRNSVSAYAQLDPDLPLVLGDRVQLQQVILNLVMNAIEAMAHDDHQPKVLSLRTAGTDDGEVAVVVEDTGPGLSPVLADRVFDQFFTTKDEGLGLGLSICRSVVEAHGSHIVITARSPRGTAFQFTLPALASQVSRQPVAAAPL